MRKLLLAVAVGVAFSAPASAQEAGLICNTPENMNALALSEGYRPLFSGVGHQQSVTTIFINPKTEGWTVHFFNPLTGIECLIDSGFGYAYKLPGNPS